VLSSMGEDLQSCTMCLECIGKNSIALASRNCGIVYKSFKEMPEEFLNMMIE